MKLEYKNEYTDKEKALITSIGPVGSGCDIEIPRKVDYIQSSLFANCPNLEKVELPKGVFVIASNAFENCRNLKEVLLPSSINYISSEVFLSCESLEKINIPNSITEISPNTFSYCESLKEITLPDSVTELRKGAFSHCYSLEKIKLSNNLNIIDFDVFWDCVSLKNIKLPPSLEFINESAFYYCGIEKVELPESIKQLCSHGLVFSNCDDLEEAIINAKCKLPIDLFCKCNNLKHIYITKESYDLSPWFVEEYKSKIKIIEPKTLDDLLSEGKSLKELSKMYKENSELII